MNAERDALEAGLLADPDNLAAHYAYADWLIEHDDLRGEFIRLQLAMEEDPDGGHLPPMFDPNGAGSTVWFTAEFEAVLQHYAPALLGPGHAYFRRYGHSACRVLRRGWVESVSLETFGSRYARALAAAPALKYVRTIEVAGAWGRDGLHQLFGMDFPQLRRLFVHDWLMADEELAALSRSKLFQQLEELDLSGCSVTNDGANALVRALTAHPIAKVNLTSNYIERDGYRTLLNLGCVLGEQRWGWRLSQIDEAERKRP